MRPFLNGFVDELVKLGAMPAPVTVPATGRGLAPKAQGRPSEGFGPTNAFMGATPPQAMQSPAKPPAQAWRPTVGPKAGAMAPAAPAAPKGHRTAQPGRDRMSFESGGSYLMRKGKEALYNHGLKSPKGGASNGGTAADGWGKPLTETKPGFTGPPRAMAGQAPATMAPLKGEQRIPKETPLVQPKIKSSRVAGGFKPASLLDKPGT